MGNVITDVAMGGMGSVTRGCRTSQVGGVAGGVGHWFGVSNGSNAQTAGNTGGNGVTHAGDSSGAMAVMSTALFAHQLPPLSKFDGCTGPGGEGETVKEWLEQFELVAGVCKWDNQTKLVNLVTRLRGEAYVFFKSCSAQERSCYEGMSAALVKRFTPVQIQAVQSSLFHEWKQGEEQALKVLFHKAYPNTQRGSPEAESMGKAVLASQFSAGLIPEIKAKVAGNEGDLDALLARARFEEAKLRDLAVGKQQQKKPIPNLPTSRQPAKVVSGMDRQNMVLGGPKSSIQCYRCGSYGHYRNKCPARNKGDLWKLLGRNEGKVARAVSLTYHQMSLQPRTSRKLEMV